MADYDDDARDGVLFRFWIRAASFPDGWPAETARAIGRATTPAAYRRALTELAMSKGVNLPEPEPGDQIKTSRALEIVLSRVRMDNATASVLHSALGHARFAEGGRNG